MPIHPLLLSKILADAVQNRPAPGVTPANLGRAVLVGYLPSPGGLTARPGAHTSPLLMMAPPAARRAGLGMDMAAWPLVKHGLGAFMGGAFKIGRSAGCDVILPDAGISQTHAILDPGKDGFTVKDAGSMNTTLLNGLPLQGETALQDGDRLGLGSVELIFMASTRLMHLLLTPETPPAAR